MIADTVAWYRSKVDWWMVPVLCIPPVAAVTATVALAFAEQWAGFAIGLAALLGVAGVYFGLVFPMRYGLDHSHLHVRFGLCRQRVLLTDISEVHPTYNPLSAPALSLDRLHVRYGPGLFKVMLISPANRERFMDDLAQRAGLTRQGERLVRL
jgi:hypothetical protein